MTEPVTAAERYASRVLLRNPDLLRALAASLDAPEGEGEHEHVGVLIGTGVTCLTCGQGLGVTCVAFPEIDLPLYERVAVAVSRVVRREVPESLGFDVDALARWLAFTAGMAAGGSE